MKGSIEVGDWASRRESRDRRFEGSRKTHPRCGRAMRSSVTVGVSSPAEQHGSIQPKSEIILGQAEEQDPKEVGSEAQLSRRSNNQGNSEISRRLRSKVSRRRKLGVTSPAWQVEKAFDGSRRSRSRSRPGMGPPGKLEAGSQAWQQVQHSMESGDGVEGPGWRCSHRRKSDDGPMA
jgi:hypothetical protein